MCDSCNARAALDLAEEVGELADEINDKHWQNESAMDFAEGIAKRAESIADWIEKNDHVTEAQETALQNMKDGAERWLE